MRLPEEGLSAVLGPAAGRPRYTPSPQLPALHIACIETGFYFRTHLCRITRVTDSIAPRQAVNPAATFTLNAAKSRNRVGGGSCREGEKPRWKGHLDSGVGSRVRTESRCLSGNLDGGIDKAVE